MKNVFDKTAFFLEIALNCAQRPALHTMRLPACIPWSVPVLIYLVDNNLTQSTQDYNLHIFQLLNAYFGLWQFV